jgi:hypothetical protein
MSAPGDLKKIARCNEDVVDRAQNKKTMHGALDEAYRDRSRYERAWRQQYGDENQ